jgi:hypothetical protein
MDKAELDGVVVPSIARDLRTRFPLRLVTSASPDPLPVSSDDEGRREVDGRADVVVWDIGGRLELTGRAIVSPVAFRPGSNEALTWQQLIADRIGGGDGLPIAEVGRRLAEPGAERAEISNMAARHVHALRARLTNPQTIVTANHAYRLDPGLVVGLVGTRPTADLR